MIPSAAAVPVRSITVFFSLLALACAAPTPATAQEGWNTAEALALVRRARDLRQAVQIDTLLQSYQAEARGFVYFFLDRQDTDERALVKSDQVALEIFWKAPDSTRQRIVGLRDAKSLPTNIRYHLDHLTVVQDEFADRIRLGDGDEVAAVVHPAAEQAESVYDFRLADSITLSFATLEPVRVYEVEVRPKNLEAPGFIGSIFLARDDGAIVRMSFTFTPASYVDKQLDYIRISLDNSLWDGRYWLPYDQTVEIRREFPYLDLPAGSVIRGHYEIRSYRFNPELPTFLFRGSRITSVSDSLRRAFPFEEDLFSRLDEDGLITPPNLDDIRREAIEIARGQFLSGLGEWRPYLPRASSAGRYNRAEGSVLGGGVSYTPNSRHRGEAQIGYAFGRRRPRGELAWNVIEQRWAFRLSTHLDRLLDLGGTSGATGAENSVAGLAFDRDYLDPYFSSGAEVSATRILGGATDGTIALAWNRFRNGRNVEGPASGSAEASAFDRPVRKITEGDGLTVRLSLGARPLRGVRVAASVEAGSIADQGFGTLRGDASWTRSWLGRGLSMDAALHSGATLGAGAPPQQFFLAGGRGTLPGYAYRSFGGDRLLLLSFGGTREVWGPWMALGGFAAVGRTWQGEAEIPDQWSVGDPDLVLYSAGFRAEAFWNVLRIELGRGLNGGTWQWAFSINPRFQRWL